LVLSTVFLAFPLFASSSPEGVSRWLDGYASRPAAESALAVLGGLGGLEEPEQEIARFLLAGDFAELGLSTLAIDAFRSLRDSGNLAGAAFVGVVRVHADGDEHERLYHFARRGAWRELEQDDAAEVAFRVARACFATSRYPEARLWLSEVPDDSSWYPFGRYLLAQTEYALGRYGRAIEAAAPIFSAREPADAIGPLRERTAVLLGNMMTEIGMYREAVELLSWPGPDSPWKERAERDRLVAHGLAALQDARFDRAERLTADVARLLDGAVSAVERSVASEADVGKRLEDLRGSWPSVALRGARSAWTAAHARRALDRVEGFGFRKVFAAAWASLPPVLLYRLFRRDGDVVPPAVAVGEESRFFFAPSGEVSRVLTAAALVEESRTRDCGAREAAALRTHAAAALLGITAPPRLGDVEAIAGGCGRGAVTGLGPVVHERLLHAIGEDARRLRRDLRSQRYALDEAVARARVDFGKAARAAEGSR